MTDKLPDEQKEIWLKQIPLNRFGNKEEVASLVLFFSQQRSIIYNRTNTIY